MSLTESKVGRFQLARQIRNAFKDGKDHRLSAKDSLAIATAVHPVVRVTNFVPDFLAQQHARTGSIDIRKFGAMSEGIDTIVIPPLRSSSGQIPATSVEQPASKESISQTDARGLRIPKVLYQILSR